MNVFSPHSSQFSPSPKKTATPKRRSRNIDNESDNLIEEESSSDDDFFPCAQQPLPTPPSSTQSNPFSTQFYCSQSEGTMHFFATQSEKIPFKLHESQTQEKGDSATKFSQPNSLQQFSQSNYQTSQRNSQLSQLSQLSPTFSRSCPESEEYFGSQLSVSSADWQVFAPENYRCVPEYTDYIIKNWRQEECHFEVKSLLEKQDEVDDNIRQILVDSMVGACNSLRVSSRALFLAVKILDLIFAKEKLDQKNALLSSSACLSLAAKMENGTYPGAGKYVAEFDAESYFFKEEDLILKEQEIFEKIDFNLTRTTIIQFLKYWLNVTKADAAISQIAMFVAVCTLLNSDLSIMKTELVSLGVILVALYARKASYDVLKSDIERFDVTKVKEICVRIVAATNSVLQKTDSSVYENFNEMQFIPTRCHYEVPPL